MYRLTEIGRQTVKNYIKDMREKQLFYLENKYDKADFDMIPSVKEVEDDLNWEVDNRETYRKTWQVTYCFDADETLELAYGLDYYEEGDEEYEH